ncbi:MAG: DMT family transporter [Oscillospiraceae bacterium]|nr:DMT family transporter [Oscillospiraceae bacterium]
MKGYIFVMLSSAIFGCMPLVAKSVYASGVNTLSLVTLRSLLAVPMLYIVLRLRKTDISIKPKELGSVSLLCAMGSAITPTLLFYSYSYISSGMATTLHFIYPVFVMLGCFLIYKDPIGKTKLLCVFLCVIGTALFYSPDSVNAMGVALSLVSGVTYAAYIIMLDKNEVRLMDPFKFQFWGSLSCSIVMLVICLAADCLTLPQSIEIWAICLLFAFMVAVIGIMLFQVGVVLTGAQNAAILSTVEPIMGTVLGILIFDEVFGIRNLLGLAAILAAVILLAINENKAQQSV